MKKDQKNLTSIINANSGGYEKFNFDGTDFQQVLSQWIEGGENTNAAPETTYTLSNDYRCFDFENFEIETQVVENSTSFIETIYNPVPLTKVDRTLNQSIETLKNEEKKSKVKVDPDATQKL